MKRTIFILIFATSVSIAHAQSDPEYMMEIGGGVGLTGYLGDFNGKLTRDLQPSASLVLRRLFNPYAGLKLSASWGKLKGSSTDVDTFYPDYAAEPYLPESNGAPYNFSNTLIDAGIVFEYNFWPYGTGRDYRGARRIAPYIFAGLATSYVSGGGDNAFTGNLPLGLGVKYKIADRLNLGVEWGVHFSMSDKLDGVEDPYVIPSSGMLKNKDCYQMLQLTVTYSFMKKCQTCHNADEN